LARKADIRRSALHQERAYGVIVAPFIRLN
jgi:hypothetical protein